MQVLIREKKIGGDNGNIKKIDFRIRNNTRVKRNTTS